MIPADEADYLEDDHVVFGIWVNGDAQAYPKRILAWHEKFTDESGGNRVYEDAGIRFSEWDQELSVSDADGNLWTLSEENLTGPDGTTLNRLPAHRAFWFGWKAVYKDTRLVVR